MALPSWSHTHHKHIITQPRAPLPCMHSGAETLDATAMKLCHAPKSITTPFWRDPQSPSASLKKEQARAPYLP